MNTPDKLQEEETKRHYAILDTLGEGAMGEVVLAKDKDLLRKVAYKKILPKIAEDELALQAFLTEAQITAQLEHPSIVPVYGLEVNHQGEIAYSMKRVRGRTFKELIQTARAQYDQVDQVDEEHTLHAILEHFLKVCDAIHYAHEKGILHRDLKPANIMIGPYNEVYVMDWGISRLMAGAQDTHTDETLIELPIDEADVAEIEKDRIIGTPYYMAPEQAAGLNERLDGRCDQFSLGLVLFELMTLKKAFTGGKLPDLIKKILTCQMEPLEPYHPNRHIPRELAAIYRKATARKRAERYVDVEAFAQDIRRYLRGESVLAQPDTRLQSILRWIGQHREMTAVIMMVMVLLSASVFAINRYRHGEALLQTQIQERKLSIFLQDVFKTSQQLNSSFIQIESQLEALGQISITLLKQDYQSPEPIYFVEGKLPASLTYAPRYRGAVSARHWIGKVAAGYTVEQVEPEMRKLYPLHEVFANMFINSLNRKPQPPYTEELIRDVVTQKNTPLIWAYVGLETGGYLLYPGSMQYPKDYNHMERPWYKEAVQNGRTAWITPYVGASGSGLLLSCEKPLFDENRKLLGVAGLDISFEYIKNRFLTSTNAGVDTVYLLDEAGKIVLSSKVKQDYDNVTNQIQKRQLFEQPEVVKAILNRQSGHLLDANQRLYTYYKIDSFDWYYVVEGSQAKIINQVVLPS